jgi:hypothetical protein
MSTESDPVPGVPPVSAAARWTGRVLSTLPVLMLFMSAGMKLSKQQMVIDGFTKMGYPEQAIIPIGIAEVVSTILYIIPQTSVLGAILLTGYLGGAIDVHVRNGEQFAGPAIFGVLIWLGLYLRDKRLRSLIPFRSL